MIDRRTFEVLLASAVAAWPLGAKAQSSGRAVRIGRLAALSAATDTSVLEALRTGLRERGWIEGRNFEFVVRYADGMLDRLPDLAKDLVRQNVHVIIAGSNPGALAVKQATNSIPIVFVTTGDPIAGGLVPSLARPGANLTGVTTQGLELSAKRLQLLKELLPRMKRIAVLTHPGSSYTEEFQTTVDATARGLGVEIRMLAIHDPSEIGKAFALITQVQADALMVLADIMFMTHRQPLIELVAKCRLPATFPERAFVTDGGLMFYGVGLAEMYRHSAIFVDKILKGAKPADLAVEQPTRFELVVNMKTATALGVMLPPLILAEATELIE